MEELGECWRPDRGADCYQILGEVRGVYSYPAVSKVARHRSRGDRQVLVESSGGQCCRATELGVYFLNLASRHRDGWRFQVVERAESVMDYPALALSAMVSSQVAARSVVYFRKYPVGERLRAPPVSAPEDSYREVFRPHQETVASHPGRDWSGEMVTWAVKAPVVASKGAARRSPAMASARSVELRSGRLAACWGVTHSADPSVEMDWGEMDWAETRLVWHRRPRPSRSMAGRPLGLAARTHPKIG